MLATTLALATVGRAEQRIGAQVKPSPLKPELQAQVLVPGPVNVQVAFALQPPLLLRQLLTGVLQSAPVHPALQLQPPVAVQAPWPEQVDALSQYVQVG